jgi:nitroreductase
MTTSVPMTTQEVHQLLRQRKSVYPKDFTGEPVSKEIISELLESANWAPTHKLTEPWRFKVFAGNGRKKLGDFLAERYRKLNPGDTFSVAQYEKMKMNPQKAGCVIAICMQRDPQNRVPEWEEVAAVACAVQNMWLTVGAYGLGAYWSTPGIVEHLHELVPMQAGEKCLGLFYIGHYVPFENNRIRKRIEDKTIWME